MAWNRPSESNPPKVRKSNFPKLALVVLTVGCLAVIGYLLLTDQEAESTSTADNQSELKDINSDPKMRRTKPIGTTFVATRQQDKTKTIDKPVIEDSEVLFKPKKQGRILVWQIKNPPVFTNQFEGYVADILSLEPGERILDTALDSEFDRSFKEALNNPIQISPDDSENVVALKMAVLETTEEVKKRVSAGERPQDIIVDAMEELNKIADYRDKLQAEFNDFVLKGSDPNEVLSYRDEANAILDEYGAQHLEAPEDIDDASELLISTKEDKIQELTEALEKEDK